MLWQKERILGTDSIIWNSRMRIKKCRGKRKGRDKEEVGVNDGLKR